ncbi:hypothetical protein FNF27_06347 [Cafeteria roenbergensis]|uniref:EF-hand domain-containing protein n=1 Tax=Cafeteria roenbergensis TaxID=33653 RepID=A0A5A8E1L6_CAFRO|nr:hypothetical protein FNF27_06347 [Cafeteria roenbergensis]
MATQEGSGTSTMDLPRIEAIFDSIDQDGDGFISKAELRAGLKALRVPFSTAAIDRFIKGCDRESVGCISRSQFVGFVLIRREALEKAFRRLDTTRNGEITAKDIRIAAHSLSIQLSNAEVDRLIRVADRDGDGSVSVDDFVDMLLLVGDTHIEGLFDHWLRHEASLDVEAGAEPPTEAAAGEPTWLLLVAGGVAGVCSRTLTAPMDRIRTVLQAADPRDGKNKRPGKRRRGADGGRAGGRATARSGAAVGAIYAEGGAIAFWRGNGTNVLKIAPETAVRFVAFDWAKRHIAGNPDNVSAAERFVAGAFAGVVSTCTVYPLEIAKTRLALSKAGEVKGIVDCLSTLVKQEGVRAIYRGLGASLLGIVPYSGTELMIFSLLRDAYAARFPDREPGVATLLASGAVASLAGQVVAFPLQLARTRLQAQGLPGRETVRYNGLAHCLRSVVMRDGFRGLYRGMLPGFLKSIPSCMISFAVFERAKATLRPFANRGAFDQLA